MKKNKKFIIFLASYIVILIFAVKNVFYFTHIPSSSMENTLKVNDLVLIVNNINKVERGKIYTFNWQGIELIKRCIAVEGDVVKVECNNVYVNGQKINEPYVSSKVEDNPEEQMFNFEEIVPEGKVFFMGDNRADSFDGRYWDERFIDKSEIYGVAVFIVYPFSDFKFIF